MVRPAADPGAEAATVVEALRRAGRTVAVAESLTGGLLAATLVDVPGASRVLRGAVVAYATDLKHELLGVDADLLRRRGAVDGEVAEQMAGGVRRRLRADYGVATTGVAGPDAQDGHAPGTVYVAVVGPEADERGPLQRRLHLPGDRGQVRRAAVRAALASLQERLDTRAGEGP